MDFTTIWLLVVSLNLATVSLYVIVLSHRLDKAYERLEILKESTFLVLESVKAIGDSIFPEDTVKEGMQLIDQIIDERYDGDRDAFAREPHDKLLRMMSETRERNNQLTEAWESQTGEVS